MSGLSKLIAFLLLLPSLALAQGWSGVLATSRAINWGTLAGLPSTFPDGETTTNAWTPPTRTQCGATLTPIGGGSDDEPQITAALASCSGTGKYVLLGPGTFTIQNIVQQYSVNNVSLRGSGPMSTFLNFTVSGSFIYMGGPSGSTGTGTFSSSYAAGTTVVTVTLASGSNPAANTIAFVQQCDTGSGSSFPTCATTPADNGSLFICGQNSICDEDGGTGAPYNHEQQAVFITNVVNNGGGSWTLTLNHGLYLPNWSTSLGASIIWQEPSTQGIGLGLEDMTLESSITNTSVYGLARASDCYACWMKGIRFLGEGTGGHGYAYIFNSESVLYFNNYGVPAVYQLSASNDIIGLTASNVSDFLVLNNIGTLGEGAEYLGGNSGIVTAYNFNRDAWTTGTAATWAFDHFPFSSFDLWEGNIGSANTEDNIWGTHGLNTYFRDVMWCYDQPFTATALSNYSLELNNFQRFDNIIGNAQGGTSGTCGTYQGSSGSGNVYLVSTGDSLAASTLMRWANVSTVTQATDTPSNSGIRCVSSEVPSSLASPNTPWENPVPTTITPCGGSATLPASFFMNSMTAHPSGGTGLSWYKVCTSWATFPTSCSGTTTPPLPVAGPDVSSGPYLGGYGTDNPASIAWMHLPIDTTLQNSYAITASSWSGGIETLTVSSLPGTKYMLGPFQFSGVSASCIPSTFASLSNNPQNEALMTGSSSTTVQYALTANPGSNACTGTMKFPDVRQFDERVYENDPTGGTATPPSCTPGSGTYTGSQGVTCTNPNGGTSIMCYNFSGSPATNGSGTGCNTGTAISGGSGNVTISTSETLYIVAGVSGESDSSVVSYTYTINAPATSFPSPLLKIAGNKEGISPRGEIVLPENLIEREQAESALEQKINYAPWQRLAFVDASEIQF